MTHEEFAHLCLKIKSGDTSIEIPCCANCKYYQVVLNAGKYRCVHPRLAYNGNDGYLVMQPEDFCSRFEQRKD